MSRATISAIIQAVLGAIGALLINHKIFTQVIDQTWISTASGIVLGIVTMVWGFKDHTETIEQFQAAIRNLMVFLTTILVSGGLSDTTVNAITGVVDAVLPVIYGALSRAKTASIIKSQPTAATQANPVLSKLKTPTKAVILILLIGGSMLASTHANAQMFKPTPIPSKLTFSLSDSATTPITVNVFKPVASASATIASDGSQIAAGLGFSFRHDKWDAASQQYITQYMASILYFINAVGNSIPAITVGILNGWISGGLGYNINIKTFMLITGVSIKFF